MRALLPIAAVFALAGCVTAPMPNPIAAAPVQARSAGIATLAFGPWEQELAPAVTRATVVARLAEGQVRAGRLPPERAAAIHGHLTDAFTALTRARRAASSPAPEHRAALAEAIRLTDLAAHLLEP